MVREFLARISKLSNPAAALVVFLAWYVSATITTLVVTDMYMSVLTGMSLVFGAVIIFMFVTFIVAWRRRRTDLVDAAWGVAFIIAAIVSFLSNSYGASVGLNVQTLVTILVLCWGVRLSVAMLVRIMNHSEDKRYASMRKQWKGNLALNTFVRVYLLQAFLATIISIAVIHINLSATTSLTAYTYIGFLIWLAGFLFESISDLQLKRFLADPHNKGRLMTTGLWQYSRHPNYFGEATMWWGIFIIALGTPFGWVGIITPVIITYLLLRVSGVPIAEKSFENKLGWELYKKQTSKFIPLPPNSSN